MAKKILIVDDNEDLRDTLALVLTAGMRGVSCSSAANGKEAVRILESGTIDLIMTDLNMPVMDGYGLIEYRNRRYSGIPLIAVTADASPKVMRRLGELGIRECLEKPFSFEAVMKVLRDKMGAGPRERPCPKKLRSLHNHRDGIPAHAGHRGG